MHSLAQFLTFQFIHYFKVVEKRSSLDFGLSQILTLQKVNSSTT